MFPVSLRFRKSGEKLLRQVRLKFVLFALCQYAKEVFNHQFDSLPRRKCICDGQFEVIVTIAPHDLLSAKLTWETP